MLNYNNMLKESCKIFKTILYYTNKPQLKSIEHIKICECRTKCERKEYSMNKYYNALFSYRTNEHFWKHFENK